MKHLKNVGISIVSAATMAAAYILGRMEFDPSWWQRLIHADEVESQAGWLFTERPVMATIIVALSLVIGFVVVPKTASATKRFLSKGGEKTPAVKSEPAPAKAK